MMEWYNNRFANFSGRAARSEYGYYILFYVVLVLVIYASYILTENKIASFFNMCILQSVMFVPMQAVTIRRLRDLGMKWNFFLLIFLPFFNLLLIMYLLLTPGQRRENQYGEDPKKSLQIVEFD